MLIQTVINMAQRLNKDKDKDKMDNDERDKNKVHDIVDNNAIWHNDQQSNTVQKEQICSCVLRWLDERLISRLNRFVTKGKFSFLAFLPTLYFQIVSAHFCTRFIFFRL